jgi:hypothetical protein
MLKIPRLSGHHRPALQGGAAMAMHGVKLTCQGCGDVIEKSVIYLKLVEQVRCPCGDTIPTGNLVHWIGALDQQFAAVDPIIAEIGQTRRRISAARVRAD